MDWKRTIERYENELTQNVIPFWQKNCVDTEFGGYFTMLDRDGSVYDTTKYMWMQWRIVYMFAELYRSRFGAGNEAFLKIARDGFDFLYKHGRTEDGSYYFALNRRGVPSMAPYSIFSDCFAAMGAIKREMNNTKWTLAAIGYMCLFAYVSSLIVYQLGGLLLGEVTFSIWTIVALALLALILYLLVRPGYKPKSEALDLKGMSVAK